MGRKRKASVLREHWIPCFSLSTRRVKEDHMDGPAQQDSEDVSVGEKGYTFTVGEGHPVEHFEQWL